MVGGAALHALAVEGLADPRDGSGAQNNSGSPVSASETPLASRRLLTGWEYRRNLGTSTTARKLELYNGRAVISLQRKGELVVSVTSDGVPTAFLRISGPGAVAIGSFPWIHGAE